MSTINFRGDAPEIADVWTLTAGGTIENTDIFIPKINDKPLPVIAGSTAAATVATAIAAAWNSTDIPEFVEATAAATSGGALTVTGDTPGVPLTIGVSTTEGDGSSADAQTFSITHTTVYKGPNDWDTAGNWSTGAVPVDSDVVNLDETVAIFYGLNQTGVLLTSMTIPGRNTATIGLPPRNTDGATPYEEFRPQFLKIGCTTLNVGQGTGSGITALWIDSDDVQTTQNIYNTGKSSYRGYPAAMFIGSHASNVLNIAGKSDVGVAFIDGTMAQYATIRIADKASLICGKGTTLAVLDQAGASNATLICGATTVTKDGTGTLTIDGDGAYTTLNVDGGLVDYIGTGDTTTLYIGPDGEVDFSGGLDPVIVGICYMYKGATLRDPKKRVTFTSGIVLVRCGLNDVTLDFGNNRTVTIA